MNEFKYQLSQLFFVILLGLAAYWAFTRLDSGVSYTRDQIVVRDDEVIAEVVDTPQEPEIILEETPDTETNTTEGEAESETQESASTNTTELTTQLEAVLALNTIYSAGVKNDNIKSVQEFLDLYFKDKDVVADGDFGQGTKQLVLDFQRAELGGGDGRIGPNTLKKMIEVLKTL